MPSFRIQCYLILIGLSAIQQNILESRNEENKSLSNIIHHYFHWNSLALIADTNEWLLSSLFMKNISVLWYNPQENMESIIESLTELKNIQGVIFCNWSKTIAFVRKALKVPAIWKEKNVFLVHAGKQQIEEIQNMIFRDNNFIFFNHDSTKNSTNYFRLFYNGRINKTFIHLLDLSEKLQTGIIDPRDTFFNQSKSRTVSLDGREIKVAMESHFPFVLMAKDISERNSGVDIKLLDILSEYMNFTYKIQRSSDGTWGTLNDGMIGMIYREEVDAAMAGMSINFERTAAVDFSIAYAFDRTVFVTRAPTQKSKTWAILLPFTWKIWVLILIMIVGMTFALFFIENGINLQFWNSKNKLTLHDSFFWIYRAILNQGCYDAVFTRTRILISCWWLYVLVVSTWYTAKLVSYLTNPGVESPIDTIPKLVEALKVGRYTCGAIRSSSDYAIFRDYPNGINKIILKTMNSDLSNFVEHDIEGLRKCLEKNYAYIAGELTIKADIQFESQFLFSKDTFQVFGYGIALSKRFWHRSSFDRLIIRLFEAGIIDKWVQNFIKKKRMQIIEDSQHNPLHLSDLQSAFILLLIGLFFAAIILSVECICQRKRLKIS